MDSDTLRLEAEALMKDRRFAEAIAVFDRHLATHGDDLKALLQLGICHLLKGSEDMFLAIHERAGKLVQTAGQLSAGVAKLWQQYQGLFIKVTATAFVLGTIHVASAQSAHRYSGGVYIKPPEPDTQPATTQSSHRYSGGVYMPPTSQPTTKPVTRPVSGHRYSAGVFLNTPADETNA